MHLKILFAKWRKFCRSLNVLIKANKLAGFFKHGLITLKKLCGPVLLPFYVPRYYQKRSVEFILKNSTV